MTIAGCGHDIGPFYTSPAGKDCCRWCDDVQTARTEARAEALKEAAGIARVEQSSLGQWGVGWIHIDGIIKAIEAKLL